MHTYTHVNIWIYVYIYAHVCTRIHTYSHTYRCGSHVIENAYRAANVDKKKTLVESLAKEYKTLQKTHFGAMVCPPSFTHTHLLPNHHSHTHTIQHTHTHTHTHTHVV